MRDASRDAPVIRAESEQKIRWQVLGWPGDYATIMSEGGIVTQIVCSEDYELLAFWLFKPVIYLDAYCQEREMFLRRVSEQ